jgi:hypothetical protein
MKYFAFLPLLLVAACASRPQLVVRPLPPSAVEPIETVRYGEVVRAYHVGRYMDPNHPETMHERHPVYRVETSARWNLHPGPPGTANLLHPPPDAAFAPPPTNDVLIAEMNRQRETTARVMLEAARLAQSYGELQGVLTELKHVVHTSALVNQRLATNEARLIELERNIQTLSTAPPTPSNAVPSFSSEPLEAPEP